MVWLAGRVLTSSVDWRVIVEVSVGTPGVGKRIPPLRVGLTIELSSCLGRCESLARAVYIVDSDERKCRGQGMFTDKIQLGIRTS